MTPASARAPRFLVRHRVERDLRGLVIVGGHLHHQPPAWCQRLEAAGEDFAMFTEPLQRGVGKDHRILARVIVLWVEFADIAEDKAQPLAQSRLQALAQFERAIDHRRRRVHPDRRAAAKAAREFHRVLAGAAAQIESIAIDEPLLSAAVLEPRENRLKGLGAITTKPVVEIGIPIAHCGTANQAA